MRLSAIEKMKKMKKYVIYDGRYHIDPDRATIFEVCDTREEAEKSKYDYEAGLALIIDLIQEGDTQK